jgi:hypothetical protein
VFFDVLYAIFDGIEHIKNAINGIEHSRKCKKWHRAHQKIQPIAWSSNSNFQWHRAHRLQFFVAYREISPKN